MVADRLANGMQAPNEIRLVVQMAVGTNLYSATIAAAKTAYAAANQPQTKLATMAPYFNSDNLHSNARGQVQLGYDTFEAIFGKPHATAP